ncbi:dienelactone hydrolase family protein [Nocardioides cynanchi]|uniref:dienelactone hydrolase family protein n=1 Tax=Nocardioides cynanchi TaxID=2558918 RepID=UPI001248AB57|nr:dienelactone hydrolase family protein [Nocardioides cynanchi]
MTSLDIETPDGTAEAYLTGEGPGVLFFIDAIGLRPQIEQMCDRIAGWGYTVLAPNVLYRSGTAAQTSPTGDLRAPGAREAYFELVGPRLAALTSDAVMRDLPAYLAALREHSEGGPGGLVGVVGYCMGARLAVRAAGLDPAVVAAAGFHGGGLVTEEPDSPHLALSSARAEFVFGHADNDRGMTPEHVERLGQALAAAGLTATNEIYPGSPHGYSMADTSMYDEPGAERSFDALEALLARTLR